MTEGPSPLPEQAASGLFCIEGGPKDQAPVVLLHGFAGSHQAWAGVIDHLPETMRFIAFDLPGHGASNDVESVGNAGVCAKAVASELETLGFDRYHLVGHSMGGATAALLALWAPTSCLSLTMLAPGGFGPEVNHALLRRFASARDKDQLAMLLEQFFGWEHPMPERCVDEALKGRDQATYIESLETIVESLVEGTEQKQLPIEKIATLPCPIKVVWGTQDKVLPTRHAHRLPGRIAVHVYERIGHMLPQEIPMEIAALLTENYRPE